MSETRKPYSPFKWILPALILAVIAIASLYMVSNNYEHETKVIEPQNRKEDSNRVDAENRAPINTTPVNANDSIAIPKHDTVK